MASGVPSFVRKSANYEELFDDENEQLPPIDATPISKIQETLSNQDKSSNSSKRKLPLPVNEPMRASGSHPGKRLRTTPSQKDGGPSPQVQKFAQMVGNQIPDDALAKWDKMSLVESAKAIPLANAQSFFLNLKHGEEIVKAARGDQRLAEEVKQLKTTIKTKDEERMRLQDTVRKLKAAETKLSKEREQLNNTIINLDKEKEELGATHAKAVRELELKVETLNIAMAQERSVFKAQKKDRYEAGYKNGIIDYMASTKIVFPDLDWSKLEAASVEPAEGTQKKEYVAAKGATAVGTKEAPQPSPNLEIEVQESGTENDIPSPDPVSTEVVPCDAQTTPEVVSTAPVS